MLQIWMAASSLDITSNKTIFKYSPTLVGFPKLGHFELHTYGHHA